MCVCSPAILLLVFEIWSQRALPFLLVSDQEDPWKRYSQVHKDRRGIGTLSQIPSSALSCVDKKPDTSKHVTERERDNYRSNQLHTILHTANIFNTCLSLEISLFFSHYNLYVYVRVYHIYIYRYHVSHWPCWPLRGCGAANMFGSSSLAECVIFSPISCAG